MELRNAALDLIALTPEQLAMEQFRQKLPLIAALVIVVVIAAAWIIRKRRK